ncbi:TolC family protein [Hymenobacter aerophilus]|uniref:TolC family protein n=1 Tax=Hymenobacter aerophilus TaxID=119644 RepID=UPI000365214B|nr:TolC family protein [Hymenobacter aerophilus]
MRKKSLITFFGAAAFAVALTGCVTPGIVPRTASHAVPASYGSALTDTTNTAQLRWQEFFTDPNLTTLIDTALRNSQELNIALQEIQLSKNEVQVRKGEYLPFLGVGVRSDVDKPGRYTLRGATEEQVRIEEDHKNPEPLANHQVGAFASWEVDIWHRLRNARKAAALRYLASVEGRNFAVTNLIAEVATSYYELLALDNQLAITRQNIDIQRNALQLVKLQKESARTTELAVQRFEAQLHNTLSNQFTIQQQITETENRINFLVGRYPQPVARNDSSFNALVPQLVRAGVPAQLLQNRPDIRQAEQRLLASNLDVQVARAAFYPALRITGSAGFEAFRPGLLFTSPQSMLFSAAGDLMAPLINRNGIKSVYSSANASQIQTAYNYERTVLNAYVEVSNQLASLRNLGQSYDEKARAVAALNQSVTISNSLFRSARAEYTEVLFTQRDALEAKYDLIELKMKQLNAQVNVYRALGGGWN